MEKTMFDANLVFNKGMNEGMKRAIRERLKSFLALEEKSFDFWNVHVKHKMNFTRQRQVERQRRKIIQAFRIVIHYLTPFGERMEDIPDAVAKKKVKKEVKGFLPPSTTIPGTEPKPATLSADQISLLAGLADLLKVKK